MPILKILISTLLLILFTAHSLAGIYKWVDNDGGIHYSQQKPMDITVEEMHIRSYTNVVIEEPKTIPVQNHRNSIQNR